ncbi:MAG: phosphoribosylformylglycinamidine synthase subunit PurQ, partial [Phycisphaerales bacterium]
ATPEAVHLNRLIGDPSIVDRFELIGLPGGFAHGDAVAAGRIMAQLMRLHLHGAFVRAIERGVPIIAPCNGFQIAAQMGLLPGPEEGEPWPDRPPRPSIRLADNESARFSDRWVKVELEVNSRCIWTQGLSFDQQERMLPIAHGEGRFIPGSDDLLAHLEQCGRIAVRYAADDNPNGSVANVAGICDATGLVLGLMPHPERYYRWTQHPFWTRLGGDHATREPLGLAMFRNAVAHARSAVAV